MTIELTVTSPTAVTIDGVAENQRVTTIELVEGSSGGGGGGGLNLSTTSYQSLRDDSGVYLPTFNYTAGIGSWSIPTPNTTLSSLPYGAYNTTPMGSDKWVEFNATTTYLLQSTFHVQLVDAPVTGSAYYVDYNILYEIVGTAAGVTAVFNGSPTSFSMAYPQRLYVPATVPAGTSYSIVGPTSVRSIPCDFITRSALGLPTGTGLTRLSFRPWLYVTGRGGTMPGTDIFFEVRHDHLVLPGSNTSLPPAG